MYWSIPSIARIPRYILLAKVYTEAGKGDTQPKAILSTVLSFRGTRWRKGPNSRTAWQFLVDPHSTSTVTSGQIISALIEFHRRIHIAVNQFGNRLVPKDLNEVPICSHFFRCFLYRCAEWRTVTGTRRPEMRPHSAPAPVCATSSSGADHLPATFVCAICSGCHLPSHSESNDSTNLRKRSHDGVAAPQALLTGSLPGPGRRTLRGSSETKLSGRPAPAGQDAMAIHGRILASWTPASAGMTDRVLIWWQLPQKLRSQNIIEF